MNAELPLEVLGLTAPILSWAEGAEGPDLPERWCRAGLKGEARERAWLIRELPTFSHDTLDEIIERARRPWQADMPLSFEATQRLRQKTDEWMTPPEGYELAEVFERLSLRYFEWSGNELAILGDRVEELHELALRFPVRHLVYHMYARGVAGGVLPHKQALTLPDHVNALHSSSWGLRAVIKHGLSEGHLHLWGVLSADDAWCDQLLGKVSARPFRELPAEDQRLLTLSRTAVRLLALGVLYSKLGLESAGRHEEKNRRPASEEHQPEGRQPLLDAMVRLDALYRAASGIDELRAEEALRDWVRVQIHATEREVKPDPRQRGEVEWLLRVIDPTAHRLWRWRSGRVGDASSSTRGFRGRMKLLARLHMEVQLLLVRRTPDRSFEGGDADAEDPEPLRGPRDELLHFVQEVFFRYLVYHTHFWQMAVQNGKTTGLRQFSKFYGARQREVRLSEVEQRGLVLERLGDSKGLRVLEARLSPPDEKGAADLTPWILAAGQAHRRGELDKFGLVLHFKKDQHRGSQLRESRVGFPVLRHGRRRGILREQAFALFRLLSAPHPVVPFIVGIDAASHELTTPPEVFAPAFRFLREYPIEIHRQALASARPDTSSVITELVKGRRLGMTYHVGEDFRHLLSGLRAIHEVLNFLNPRPGDRLGHATALALDPEVWAAHIGFQAVLPRLEWLDSLVWLHHFMGPGHELVARLGIEDEIQRFSRQIYEPMDFKELESGQARRRPRREIPKPERSPQTLHDSWRLRQLDPRSVDASTLVVAGKYRRKELTLPGPHHRRWSRVQHKVGRTLDQEVGSQDAYRLLSLYWFDERVQRQGEHVIDVDMKRRKGLWLDLCHQAQEKLIRLVEERQLVVEANPTSNRVIGPMSELEKHPIFRLTLDADKRLQRRIRVTVNTDDPGVFDTSLAHEYYLLAENLLARGAAEAEVVNWLEWLRKNGEEYSFLHSLPPFDDPRIQMLLRSLEEVHQDLLPRLSGRRRDYRWRLEREALKSRKTDEHRTIRRLERELDRERTLRNREIEQLQKSLDKLEKRPSNREIEQLQQRLDKLEERPEPDEGSKA